MLAIVSLWAVSIRNASILFVLTKKSLFIVDPIKQSLSIPGSPGNPGFIIPNLAYDVAPICKSKPDPGSVELMDSLLFGVAISTPILSLSSE